MIQEFHPDLLPKIRELIITANRNVLTQTLTGSWLSTFKGRGIEFSDYRQYTVGDDASMIDWKASLRAQKILVKELTEEKNLKVHIVVDVSNTMLYGSQELLKAEYAAEVASSVAYVALRAQDAVGLVMMAEDVRKYIEPDISVRQHNRIITELAKTENYGGTYNFGKGMQQLLGIARGRGMLIFIGDFIHLEEKWYRYLEIASQRFELIGIAVRDRRDRRLPKHAGEYTLEDPITGERMIIDCAQYWKPYEEYVAAEEQRIRSYFQRVRGDLLILENEQEFAKTLMRFFHRLSLREER